MQWLIVGAVLIAALALGIAGVLVMGVPALGLAPAEIHISHRTKRLGAATAMGVVVAVTLVVVALDHGPSRGVRPVAAGAGTSSARVTADPGSAHATSGTRPSSHRRSPIATDPGTPTTGSAPGSSSTSTRGAPQGHTPTTTGARRPSRSGPTTTAPSGTTPTTRGPTTTTPGTTPRTQPPPTQPPAPTTTAPGLVGDLNLDGRVGCLDENIVLRDLGRLGSGMPADLNHDGVVDTADLAVLLAHWTGDGTSCLL